MQGCLGVRNGHMYYRVRNHYWKWNPCGQIITNNALLPSAWLVRTCIWCIGRATDLQTAMDSSSSRSEEGRRKQAEIRKQITLLQAQLVDIPGEDHNTSLSPSSPKRSKPDETLLASATPSPSEPAMMRKYLCCISHAIVYQKGESWITQVMLSLIPCLLPNHQDSAEIHRLYLRNKSQGNVLI